MVVGGAVGKYQLFNVWTKMNQHTNTAESAFMTG